MKLDTLTYLLDACHLFKGSPARIIDLLQLLYASLVWLHIDAFHSLFNLLERHCRRADYVGLRPGLLQHFYVRRFVADLLSHVPRKLYEESVRVSSFLLLNLILD